MAKTHNDDAAADFDLLAWLETGTITTRKVTLYIDHEAVTEYNEIGAKLAAINDGDQPRSEAPEGIHERATELEARLHDSRMVWTVRAISREEMDQAFIAVPEPKPPVALKDGANAEARARYMEKIETYGKAKRQADDDRTIALLAVAIQSVETAAGVREAVTTDELKALRARPHGQQWLDLLWHALNQATDDRAQPDLPQ